MSTKKLADHYEAINNCKTLGELDKVALPAYNCVFNLKHGQVRSFLQLCESVENKRLELL